MSIYRQSLALVVIALLWCAALGWCRVDCTLLSRNDVCPGEGAGCAEPVRITVVGVEKPLKMIDDNVQSMANTAKSTLTRP